MPIARLDFKLPEEREEYEYAINGLKYSLIIDDLDNWLRDLYKYQDKRLIGIHKVRQKLNEISNEYLNKGQ